MKKLNLTDKRNPDYFYSEAIKTLRTNIQLSGQSIKTILVTSCYPNEGKSDVVLSLARELGSIGKKVLLLDADIRKTAYAGRLGVEEEVKGLSQLLSGQVGLQEIIYSTNLYKILNNKQISNKKPPAKRILQEAFLFLL